MERIKELFQRGFFHILGSTVINKIIAFLANIAIVRILTKHDYGVFTGAFNVFFIVFLFSGMGIVNGILYYCSKDVPREEKKSFYAWAVRFGLWTEVLLSAAILIYGLFFNVGIEEMRVYILSLAPLPFLAFIFDYYSIILRAEKDNKRYSLYLNIHSALYAGLAILGGLCFGIAGTIAGRYLAYVIADVIGYYFCRDYADISWKGRPSPEARKDIRKYSLKAGITSALNVILYRIDVAVIALVVADASVLASYKTGAQLPENMNFIPQSLMVDQGDLSGGGGGQLCPGNSRVRPGAVDCADSVGRGIPGRGALHADSDGELRDSLRLPYYQHQYPPVPETGGIHHGGEHHHGDGEHRPGRGADDEIRIHRGGVGHADRHGAGGGAELPLCAVYRVFGKREV